MQGKGVEDMGKCIASENGICRNVIGFGTKCNGYSENCSLKPHYDYLQKVHENAINAVKRSFGIKRNREE